MIAIVLIVWNAFNIVTAAGDTEKIDSGKKGLPYGIVLWTNRKGDYSIWKLWVVIGLALTMFAYVIVKTVVMLTYTQ